MRFTLKVKYLLRRVLEEGVKVEKEVTKEEKNLNIEMTSTAITVEKLVISISILKDERRFKSFVRTNDGQSKSRRLHCDCSQL